MDSSAGHLLQQFAQLRVLVIGDVMVDRYIEGSVHRLCREAAVPVFDSATVHEAGGGAANTACNCAALGAMTAIIGMTGDDAAGEALASHLAGHGVDVSGLVAAAGRRTSVKQRFCAEGRLLFRCDEGDPRPIEASDELLPLVAKAWSKADVVILSDYGQGVLSAAVLRKVEKLQAKSPKLLAADSHDLARLAHLAPDVVKPSYREAAVLAGLPASAADRASVVLAHRLSILEATGARIAAVTLDGEGAVVLERDGRVHRSHTTRRPELHTIGAGDTYLCAFALTLAAGNDAAVAAHVAAAAGEVAVSKPFTSACSAAELQFALESEDRVFADVEQFRAAMKRLHAEGKRIVFTNGCFDILHSGHVAFLREARELGDVLVVAVNSDAGVERLKGPGRPVNGLADRVAVLAGVESIDVIAVYDEDRPFELLQAARPSFYVKGGDYRRDMLPEAPVAEALGCEVRILPYIERQSTSRLIERIQEAERRVAARS